MCERVYVCARWCRNSPDSHRAKADEMEGSFCFRVHYIGDVDHVGDKLHSKTTSEAHIKNNQTTTNNR